MAARRSVEFGSVPSLLLMGVFFFFFFCIWPPSPAFAYGGSSTAESATYSAKMATEKVEVKASKATQDVKQTSESRADWAGGKIAEGLGTMQENAKVASEKTKDKAGDIAMKAKDMTYGAASGAAEYTSHEAGQAKEAVKNKAGGAKDNIADMAGNHATAADDGKRAYQRAKQKVAESYASAKDTMAGGAREKYEAAKERASQVSGGGGAKMQEMGREL
ncbi:hypothetical protein OPV22_006853 [Ensete ventricosum]|uniref:Uncharacterized protein n=1 Tax=Ensete ventricosum TaxID=4639 RepID=A0AAV8RM95_ENSVE|nr:hypothetical protein OPV22_006853 [Ensete ventricosum]